MRAFLSFRHDHCLGRAGIMRLGRMTGGSAAGQARGTAGSGSAARICGADFSSWCTTCRAPSRSAPCARRFHGSSRWSPITPLTSSPAKDRPGPPSGACRPGRSRTGFQASPVPAPVLLQRTTAGVHRRQPVAGSRPPRVRVGARRARTGRRELTVHHVFSSYARSDREWVDDLASRLRRDGIRVWPASDVDRASCGRASTAAGAAPGPGRWSSR